MAERLRWVWLLGLGILLAQEPVAAGPTTETARQTAFLTAYEQGRFAQALALAQEALVGESGASATWWLCLGAAAARADDPGLAVDGVVRGQRLGGRPDAEVLALHLTALTRIHAFTQARETLLLGRARHPYSPLAARDTRLALAIERRLAEPIAPGAVTWQMAQASAALAAGRPGLAWVHAQEARALARQGGLPWTPAGALVQATVALELGDPAAAEVAVADFPPTAADSALGLLRLSAQLAGSRWEQARQTLAALEPGTPAMQARLSEARALLNDIPGSAPSGGEQR